MDLLKETLLAGLRRSTMTTPSRWAEKCRVMGNPFPGPWTFNFQPWLREVHDSKFEVVVARKAAQTGFTETALNLAFFYIDILKLSCLYLLPSKVPAATNFSSSRFTPAIELSPHLSTLFTDVSNVGHKRSGPVNLFVRGSRSRTDLKSDPISLIIFDELDEMNQNNVVLALERQSGQSHKKSFYLSTPTVEQQRIDKLFQHSNQKHFFFKCPSCGRSVELLYPASLVIIGDDPDSPDLNKSYYCCPECKTRLPDNKPSFLKSGFWVPTVDNMIYDGYTINQMYSSTVSAAELARYVLLAPSSPSIELELYNSKLGLPHTIAGSRLTHKDLEACIHEYPFRVGKNSSVITMGIDVGTYLHYVVCEWKITDSIDINMGATPTIIEYGKKKDFESLHQVIQLHKPNYTVIDANPERRKAFEFAQRYWGHVSLCFYGNNSNGKQITKTRDSDGVELELSVTVDRTSWLDLVLSRFRNNTIEVPSCVDRDFKDHICALVRRYRLNNMDVEIGYYENYGDDHYAHALNYAEIALKLAEGLGASANTESPR